MNHGDESYANDGPTDTQLEKPEEAILVFEVVTVSNTATRIYTGDTEENPGGYITSPSCRIVCSIAGVFDPIIIQLKTESPVAVGDILKIVKA